MMGTYETNSPSCDYEGLREKKHSRNFTFSQKLDKDYPETDNHNIRTPNQNDVDSHSCISSNLRMNNLERRMENMEKMLRFYENMLKLKDEEKENEMKIDKNKINDLNNKIDLLESNIRNLNKVIQYQNDLITNRLNIIEKKLSQAYDNKCSLDDVYNEKLNDLEEMIKRNDIYVENMIDDKSSNLKVSFDMKIDEVLNLINDVGKLVKENELNLLETKETMRNNEHDGTDVGNVISNLKDKLGLIEYLVDEVSELKYKYENILKLYTEQTEEECKFIKKMLNTSS